MTAAPAKMVPCPRCGTLSAYAPENRWRPFCSERCRMIDLGAWANEEYRVPVSPEDDSKEKPADPAER